MEVVLPTTPAEAAEAFGDGDGVTVVGGGTIVVPELTHGRLRPSRVVMLARSGLDGLTRANGAVTIGAACSVAALEGGDEPLASAALHVADPEIRGQATVGGNLCSGEGADVPRGDLQAPLIALGARVRSTGAGGERTEPVEDFLAGGGGRSCSTSPMTTFPARAGTPPSRGRTPITTRFSPRRRRGRTGRCVSP